MSEIYKNEKAEDALREIEKLAKIGHWELDLSKSELTWSDEIFTIFGVKRGVFKVSAENFEKAIHPDDLEFFLRERKKALTYGKEIDIIHRIVRPDGEIRHVHERATIICDENGKAEKRIGTVQDVTERVQVEEEALRIKNFSQTVIDRYPEQLMVINRDYTIAYANGAVKKTVGNDPVSLGLKCFQVSHNSEVPCNEGKHPCPISHVVATKAPYSVEHVHYDSKGDENIVEVTAAPIFDADGEVLQIIESARDITERRLVEKKNAEHILFLENMNSINKIMQKSSDSNQMMSDVLQKSLEIFDSDRAWLLYPCDPDVDSWSVPMERTKPEYPGALKLGEELPMTPEVKVVCRHALKINDVITIDSRDEDAPKETDQIFNIQSQIQLVIRPKYGKPWLFGMHQCSYNRDWTKNDKNLFREIGNRISDTLNVLLILDDLRISEKRVLNNEQILKETNKSLEDMVSIASHDLQVPLVSIEGYASALLEDNKNKLDDEGVYRLSRLKVNSQRMLKLVRSLLDISRLNTRKNPYNEFSLESVVGKISSDLGLFIENKKATISYEELPTIYADKERIESVIRNIIVNSLVYGGVDIRIVFEDNKLMVIDDGIGMPTDQLEKVFDPGERLKLIDVEGVGMGLTYSKRAIEQHNGTIYAQSQGENTGTTIIIEFDEQTLRG